MTDAKSTKTPVKRVTRAAKPATAASLDQITKAAGITGATDKNIKEAQLMEAERKQGRSLLQGVIRATAQDIVGLKSWIDAAYPDMFNWRMMQAKSVVHRQYIGSEDAIRETFKRIVEAQRELGGNASSVAVDVFRSLVKEVFIDSFPTRPSEIVMEKNKLYDRSIGYLEHAVIAGKYTETHRSMVKDMIGGFLTPMGDPAAELRFSKERTMVWYDAPDDRVKPILDLGDSNKDTGFSEESVSCVLMFAMKQMLKASTINLKLAKAIKFCTRSEQVHARVAAAQYLGMPMREEENESLEVRAFRAYLLTAFNLAEVKYKDMRASYLLSEHDLRAAVKYGFINFRSLREARSRLLGDRTMYKNNRAVAVAIASGAVDSAEAFNQQARYEETIQDVFGVICLVTAVCYAE